MNSWSRLTGLLLAGCTLASPGHADGGPSPAKLERLVRQDCGSCHGLSLKGGLGPDLRAKRLGERSADELARIILDGVPGTAMPPWRPLLSETEAMWIANYLLTEPQE